MSKTQDPPLLSRLSLLLSAVRQERLSALGRHLATLGVPDAREVEIETAAHEETGTAEIRTLKIGGAVQPLHIRSDLRVYALLEPLLDVDLDRDDLERRSEQGEAGTPTVWLRYTLPGTPVATAEPGLPESAVNLVLSFEDADTTQRDFPAVTTTGQTVYQLWDTAENDLEVLGYTETPTGTRLQAVFFTEQHLRTCLSLESACFWAARHLLLQESGQLDARLLDDGRLLVGLLGPDETPGPAGDGDPDHDPLLGAPKLVVICAEQSW